MKEILSSLFARQVAKLNLCFDEIQSTNSSAPLFGYVHLLNSGNALFISDERKPYLVSLEFTIFYKLKTGDRIQARTGYNSFCDSFVVEQIIAVEHVAYQETAMVPAQQNFTLNQHKVRLGTSVLVPIKDDCDLVQKVTQIQRGLPTDTTPFLLSFDGRMTNFNFAHSCFTQTNQTAREKLMKCLLTFFQCKQQACAGKNVVLVIDSLDKMFTVFNGCMQSVGVLDPNLFSSAAVMDFENILTSSGNLRTGGSLTIIGLHRTGLTPQQLQITDRLHQVLDQIVEL